MLREADFMMLRHLLLLIPMKVKIRAPGKLTLSAILQDHPTPPRVLIQRYQDRIRFIAYRIILNSFPRNQNQTTCPKQ